MIKIWDLPANEIDALTYFQNYEIIPSKKLCLNGHDMSLYMKTDKQWRCNVTGCDKRIGIRKDTWFQDSRLPFVTALRFIYSWSKQLTSIEWGKEQLDMADKTTTDWNNYMREVCIHTLLQRPKIKIGGPKKSVEIDESLFSKRKNNAERILQRQWIFGGICKETEECFLVEVPDVSAATLMAEIINYIEDGSIIHSDTWSAYQSEELKAAGFQRFKVKHRYNFVDTSTRVRSQPTERLWGSSKWRNRRRGTKREHLDSHFPEFLWRRLHKEDDQFIAILKSIQESWPPKSEYWKSLPRKYCDICKCWFADNKASIEFHERGKRHQENAAKRIQDIQKRGIKDFKKQKKLEEDMEKIEKAALAAYQKDLQNNVEAIPNPTLANNITNSTYSVPTTSKIDEALRELKRSKENKTKTKKAKLPSIPKPVTIKREISEESSNGVEVQQETVPQTRKWYEAVTEEGYKYYWHAETSDSCWEPPEEGFISLEEQEALNSETTSEDYVVQIKQEVVEEEEVEKNNAKNEKEPMHSFGPQPRVDPYGQWTTVVKEELVEVDLQLPKPSEELISIVVPVASLEPRLNFKEKVVGQIENNDSSEGVTFKKRKFTGSSAKRNARQRNLDDD